MICQLWLGSLLQYGVVCIYRFTGAMVLYGCLSDIFLSFLDLFSYILLTMYTLHL